MSKITTSDDSKTRDTKTEQDKPLSIKDCVISTYKYPEEITIYDNNYRPVIFSPYTPLESKSLNHKGVVRGSFKIPKELIPKYSEQIMTFTVENSLNCYTNSIRRVLVTELPTYALHVDNATFTVNEHDKVIDYDKVNVIVTSIPLRQDLVKNMSRFYLKVTNKDIGSAGSIRTRDIKNNNGVSIVDLNLCNDMELFEIYPGASLYTELEVKFLSGNIMGQHSAAYRVCMNSDVDILNKTTGVKEEIRRPFKMSFSTNGQYDCKTLLLDTINNIISRYESLIDNVELYLLSVNKNEFIFSINNETHTLLEPINKECLNGRFKTQFLFSSIHKSVDPYIKLHVKFSNLLITREEGLKLIKTIMTDCKNNFTLSKESIDNIHNAKEKDMIITI
jgi:DNA-directed RNA polymerase subunit L